MTKMSLTPNFPVRLRAHEGYGAAGALRRQRAARAHLQEVLQEAACVIKTGVDRALLDRLKKSVTGRRVRHSERFEGTCYRPCARITLTARSIWTIRSTHERRMEQLVRENVKEEAGVRVGHPTEARKGGKIMLLTSPISFPNLGITVDPDPVAFTVMGRISTGTALLLRALCARFLLCSTAQKTFGITQDDVLDTGCCGRCPSALCARGFFCLTGTSTETTPSRCSTSGRASLRSTAASSAVRSRFWF